MAGEKSLIDTLHNEVTKLLEAHRRVDERHRELAEELQTIPHPGAYDDYDETGDISPLYHVFEEEEEEIKYLEDLAFQLEQDPGLSAEPHKLSEDIARKLQEARQRKGKRSNNPKHIYKQVRNALDTARSSEAVDEDSTLQKMHDLVEHLKGERNLLSTEAERLKEVEKSHAEEGNKISESALSLHEQVAEIEAKFKARSRFGAWLCDVHADDTTNEISESSAAQMDTLREELAALKSERRYLKAIYAEHNVPPMGDSTP